MSGYSKRKRKREKAGDFPERPWDTDGLLELRWLAMQNLEMAEALAPLLVEGALQ